MPDNMPTNKDDLLLQHYERIPFGVDSGSAIRLAENVFNYNLIPVARIGRGVDIGIFDISANGGGLDLIFAQRLDELLRNKFNDPNVKYGKVRILMSDLMYTDRAAARDVSISRLAMKNAAEINKSCKFVTAEIYTSKFDEMTNITIRPYLIIDRLGATYHFILDELNRSKLSKEERFFKFMEHLAKVFRFADDRAVLIVDNYRILTPGSAPKSASTGRYIAASGFYRRLLQRGFEIKSYSRSAYHEAHPDFLTIRTPKMLN